MYARLARLERVMTHCSKERGQGVNFLYAVAFKRIARALYHLQGGV